MMIVDTHEIHACDHISVTYSWSVFPLNGNSDVVWIGEDPTTDEHVRKITFETLTLKNKNDGFEYDP